MRLLPNCLGKVTHAEVMIDGHLEAELLGFESVLASTENSEWATELDCMVDCSDSQCAKECIVELSGDAARVLGIVLACGGREACWSGEGDPEGEGGPRSCLLKNCAEVPNLIIPCTRTEPGTESRIDVFGGKWQWSSVGNSCEDAHENNVVPVEFNCTAE